MIPLSDTGLFREKQLEVLKKKGLRSVADLLRYYPKRYVDRSARLDPSVNRPGDLVTFIGTVIKSEVRYGRRKRVELLVKNYNLICQVTFFHAVPYYSKTFTPGVEAAFSGKVDLFRGAISLVHPEVEIVTGEELLHTGKVVPIYPLTDMMKRENITLRAIREAVRFALDRYGEKIDDYIGKPVLEKYNLLSLPDALMKIHFPDSLGEVESARTRLAFNELLVFAAVMQDLREQKEGKIKPWVLDKKSQEHYGRELLSSLPFSLTKDQEQAVEHLRKMSQRPSPFGALLQGDVGSGKTVVALLLALDYISAGYQVAFMAPTEILAVQHYTNFINYLSFAPMLPVELLTGSEKGGEKKGKIDRIQRGDTLFVVGTHALIQESVKFHNLALVIIDEQHRFGVGQREALRGKGVEPDLLSMSATPIPRSLTLTVYGDLEPVILKQKPGGRKPVDTRVFHEQELDSLYKGVKKYVDQGRQAYIVYPVIEESEKTEWASVMADFGFLEKQVFSGYRLGLLHGRLSPEEKAQAMSKFKSGLIQILVTTTVVEVGVDVPNATVMMIRNAEKFGLAQLHQLRGRVGRGEHQSFCILVHSSNPTTEAELRLNAMVESNDGFYLAQKDFEIRGSGELMDTKQSGVSDFQMADLRKDADLAGAAREVLAGDREVYESIKKQKNWRSLVKKGYIVFSG